MTKYNRKTAELNRWAQIGAELEEGSRSSIARAIRAEVAKRGRGRRCSSYLAAVGQAFAGDPSGASYILSASRTLGPVRRAR